ncbi:hypothetical protein CQ12_38900 [Bradyrhizobium jicamae]|uniref:Uncharacterized protein n=1 Tax=Bradyrhizobium jicamae TaxID=280332 RepID=A0A0R3KDD3_9BRAD|nr:hypothetical protein CQ12_38900 [Bradyrhizobium jicamae]
MMASLDLIDLLAGANKNLGIEFKARMDTRSHETRAKLARHIAAQHIMVADIWSLEWTWVSQMTTGIATSSILLKRPPISLWAASPTVKIAFVQGLSRRPLRHARRFALARSSHGKAATRMPPPAVANGL